MPGANLTRVEAQERASIVSNPKYAVSLDLTQGPKSFISEAVISFDAAKRGASTFLDLIGSRVDSVELNGVALDPAEVWKDSRIELKGLKAHNEARVKALCDYSHTGEGLHRSVDPSDGRVYLYSQFEVPDARRMYAVFDQPDLKATFDFSVVAPQSWIVLGNMPASSCEPVDQQTQPGTLEKAPAEGCKRWVFETTPKMSSYLTAICAGPYAKWTTEFANEDGRTVPMGLYCRQALRPALEKDVDYLFDVTQKGFAFYAKTWGVPYPYAKYDQIFVPEYNAGAMENIGLVTFRDQYIFESKATGAKINRRVETVLHELAHMWFGDLVTMKWWNDLWLNESFAEFMSTLCTAEATEWSDDWATFCSGEKSWALTEDQLPTTHPIVAPINDLHDTEVNFDGITYAKGASVLKQLVAYVGRERFFEGIHNYLDKHAYGNATLADLLAELEATSGRDLKAWSAKWLQESGINTLTTKLACDESGVITSFAIEQSAPEEHPVLRPHRLAVGFYSMGEDGQVMRTDRFEVDIDGASTPIAELVGKRRPDFILVNDDDLTYAKLRLDADSLAFARDHLGAFNDSLARAIVLLGFWDMTRDGQYPAEDFIDVVLRTLATERQSTTFRYALAQLSTTAHSYVADKTRPEVLEHVAQGLWKLAMAAEPGSDEQLQLVQAYLGYGDDEDFGDHARALLAGESELKGLEVDNNMRWAVIHAMAAQNMASEADIQAELDRRDSTENREFAMGARAARPSKAAKAWAWDQALHNADLTNAQIEAVADGFSGSGDEDLFAPYVDKFFKVVDWVWSHKTFHIAETLLNPLSAGGLYPYKADPAALVRAGEHWLADHTDAPKALRGMIIQNVEASRRVLRVRAYNQHLSKRAR
ncbi:Alanine aminopeptidase [Bifidobacterium actinocoloniiforme DSM 22766]|uniref:Aminopeptidase N n=1 Tax=Bifidobacterium actinocoloniiforme DSM 22766 TaxID=1437605 RepID=A0A086YZI0_9BIFI|nr:aminopeptidase N [Bifidobacterium actinocoloniiforme]AKV55005.1 aminopeptidase N [Bifidobacterium actinocoloniiforme DSM 22766]KFI39680.1 Alanine aminopeptidase [Bifidobacterium actinocoloniiforme DSM 22766]